MKQGTKSNATATDQADDVYLQATDILDYGSASIQSLIQKKGWVRQPLYERIGAKYDYVRNDIAFGYNESDDIPASRVLADGYGQCNTKGSLLMALFRATGIQCRFHGFTIHKELQKGAITGLWYRLAPTSIIHSWVEVKYEGKWVSLEGFILDDRYLSGVQRKFPTARQFCGFGAAVKDLQNPPVEWQGKDTFIQKEGINHDYGVFDSPDQFYKKHGTNLSGVKRFFYKKIIRKVMNRNLERIRRTSG